MSKPDKSKRRKKKTGYINLVKPSRLKHEFSSFAEFAKHMVPKGTAVA